MKREDARNWIYENTAGHRGLIALSVVCSAVDSALAVALSLCAKYVVDAAVAADHSGLLSAGAAAVCAVLLHLGLRMLDRDLQVRVAGKLEMQLKNEAFASLLSGAYASVSARHSGEWMTRLTADVTVVTDTVATLLPTAAAMLTRLVCAFGVIAYLDWRFAVALLLAGAALFLGTRLLRGKLKQLHRGVQETDGRLRAFLQETLENLLAVQAFGAQEKASEGAYRRGQDHYKAKLTRNRWSIFANTGFSAVFSGGFLFALLWSGVRLGAGAISFGTLTALLQLVNQVQAPVSSLSGLLPKYYAMLASAERLMEVYALPRDAMPNGEAAPDRKTLQAAFTRLHIRGVSFSYGRAPVLQDAELTVARGEFVVVSGASGIGKSTLFKLLLGVLAPLSGAVTVECGEAAYPASRATRGLFAYVPQGNLLFSGTVRENLCFVKPDATDDELRRALSDACAGDFLSTLPDGLETELGEGGYGLSEGQAQRLAVARALLTGAPVLLLDEATSALDAATERALLSNLRALPGKTCLLITHKTAALDLCDRAFTLENGRIAPAQDRA